jgi:predicted anti-sigma-YlaC factor YlaD
MSGHLNDERIESYLKRELSPEDQAQMDAHLNACSDCRSRLKREERVQAGTTSLLQTLQSEAQEPQEHLSFEQLEAWADDRLDPVDREIVDSHLEICSLCRFEADDLRVYRTILTTYPEKEYAPSSSPSWIHQKLFAFLHSPSRITKWHLAAVFCLCALLFWAASRPLLNRMNDFQSQATMVLELKNPQPDPNQRPSRPVAPGRTTEFIVTYPLILKDGGRSVGLNEQGALTGFEWLPEADQHLIREAMKTYRIRNSGPSGRYEAKTLEEKRLQDRIKRRAQGSLVAESVLLIQSGFITEAQASLQKLAEENPKSLLVNQWIQSARRGEDR